MTVWSKYGGDIGRVDRPIKKGRFRCGYAAGLVAGGFWEEQVKRLLAASQRGSRLAADLGPLRNVERRIDFAAKMKPGAESSPDSRANGGSCTTFTMSISSRQICGRYREQGRWKSCQVLADYCCRIETWPGVG